MLLGVEGGGFFSSSALGYSKGLALLILGPETEDKHMKVSPWNQYQLVQKKITRDTPLASKKRQLLCGCGSFICFGRSSAGRNGSSPPKVDHLQTPQTLPVSSSSSGRNAVSEIVDGNGRTVLLRSSLKKASASCSLVVDEGDGGNDCPQEVQRDVSSCIGRRTLQWSDACGRELVEVKEFELSDEDSSDEEYELDSGGSCQCIIQ